MREPPRARATPIGSPEDATAYQEPTDKRPLTLLINNDMASLKAFKKYLTAKTLTENEIKTRLRKCTSHLAFHLYQMYESAQALVGKDEDAPGVAMTL